MLKIIAIIMMTLDHADRILFDQAYTVLTILGRFAFPLFAFLIARNGLYTRNPGRYIGMLFLFAVISQPIYSYVMEHPLFCPLNVLFTLALGLLAVQAWLRGYWWALPFIIVAGRFVDYGMAGVAVIPVIAFTIHSINNRDIWHSLTLAGMASIVALSFAINSTDYFPYVVAAFVLGFLSLVPQLDAIEKKLRWPSFRIFFYWFYPVHFLLLAFIGQFIDKTWTI